VRSPPAGETPLPALARPGIESLRRELRLIYQQRTYELREAVRRMVSRIPKLITAHPNHPRPFDAVIQTLGRDPPKPRQDAFFGGAANPEQPSTFFSLKPIFLLAYLYRYYS
jgi:hypothetical protein